MKTRNGVCYDLKLSDYKLTLNDLTFVFSSKLHLDKFKKRYEENRKHINRSLSKRFNLDIDVSALADIILYKKIETRGFLIVNKEDKKTCQNNIIFGGGTVTPRNYNAR